MAINYFIGPAWDQPKLETALGIAQRELAEGRSYISGGTGDLNLAKTREHSIVNKIALILRALNALDPITYPIDQIVPIDRTKAVFS